MNMIAKYKPEDGFPYYFDLVKDIDLESLYSSSDTSTFLQSISEEKGTYRFAPDKWSIKEIIGHITDHERIKMYRAFLLSRNIPVQLWGYDQITFVKNSRFKELTINHLIHDYMNIRKASISFIEGLSKSQLALKGMARQHEISLTDFLKSIIGHENHHIDIIKERYK